MLGPPLSTRSRCAAYAADAALTRSETILEAEEELAETEKLFSLSKDITNSSYKFKVLYSGDLKSDHLKSRLVQISDPHCMLL